MTVLRMASMALAAAMGAVNLEVPPMGGRPTPMFVHTVERDGLGRKKKPKQHPRHNARRQDMRWREFKRRVEATRSDREDPRADHYLHSHARTMRALKRALAARDTLGAVA